MRDSRKRRNYSVVEDVTVDIPHPISSKGFPGLSFFFVVVVIM